MIFEQFWLFPQIAGQFGDVTFPTDPVYTVLPQPDETFAEVADTHTCVRVCLYVQMDGWTVVCMYGCTERIACIWVRTQAYLYIYGALSVFRKGIHHSLCRKPHCHIRLTSLQEFWARNFCFYVCLQTVLSLTPLTPELSNFCRHFLRTTFC